MRMYVCIPGFENRENAMALLGTVCDEIVVHDKPDRPSEEELKAIARDYDATIIGVKERMTPSVFASVKRLRYVCTLSIGTDHICQEFMNSEHVTVINAPTANVHSVAEFMLAYILSSLKDFVGGDVAFRNGSGRDGMDHIPYELSSQTIGVVGAGKIATRFLELLGPFVCKRLVWTFLPAKHPELSASGVEFTTLENMARNADFLVIAVPLSDKTRGIVGRRIFDAMRGDARVVSISRLEVMDLPAFLENVSRGRFVGSLLDCFPKEIDVEAVRAARIILTPHVAGISRESRLRMAEEVAQGLIERVS